MSAGANKERGRESGAEWMQQTAFAHVQFEESPCAKMPKLCLLILFVTCSMIPYRFAAVCCLLLLPHLRWLIDSMAFSMNRIISRCQDMNRLETQNWINAQRKSVGTMRIKRVRGRNEIDDDVDDGDSEHFEKIIYTPANRCIICLEYGMRWDQTRWNDNGNMLAKRNWSYHWEGIWHDDEEEQQKPQPQQHQNRQCKRNDEENATKCVHWTRTTERLKANSKQKVKTRYRNKKE